MMKSNCCSLDIYALVIGLLRYATSANYPLLFAVMYQIAPVPTACSFLDLMRVIQMAPGERFQPRLLDADGVVDLVGELDLSL